MSHKTRSEDRAVRTSMRFLGNLLAPYHPRDFDVRFWDGTTWEAEPGVGPRFTLVLSHPGSLRRMFLPPSELSLAEAYVYGDCDLEGNVHAVFPLADFLLQERRLPDKLGLAAQLLTLPTAGPKRETKCAADLSGSPHSVDRDRRAVTYHYDLPGAFFGLWLDRAMLYSCAFFESAEQDLDRAQQNKMDYVCRKLRLAAGDRLLDIGCGWGALAVKAARDYGATVLGITLSRPQAEVARELIKRERLEGRCRVEVLDYRSLGSPLLFDKLVSVGMFEHVGRAGLPGYFSRARELLAPRGVFLNHGIASSACAARRRQPSFIDRYVFPDGELLPVSETLRLAEEAGFEVRDVEGLREHYALTLRHWVKRLEQSYAEALRQVDETTWRIWRLYMAASAHGFETGRINVYQALLVKPERGASGMPLTRNDWYARELTPKAVTHASPGSRPPAGAPPSAPSPDPVHRQPS